jgi:IQ domain-containing protein H
MTNTTFVEDTHELSVTFQKRSSKAQSIPAALSREPSTVGNSPLTNKAKSQKKLRSSDLRARSNQRFAVASSRLLHSNMNMIQYNVFFQICRAEGIGYDIKEQQGSLFMLRDPFKREFLTMVTVYDQLGDAMAMFAKNLNILNQEASSSNTAARSNFKVCT